MDDLINPKMNERIGSQPTQLEREEFSLIQARRIKALAPAVSDALNDPSSGEFRAMVDGVKAPQHERSLVGLAISGGGIRSATFGLGVLQALAELGLLKYVDYLSTVSGGGYIGGWFAAWVKREGDFQNVNQQLIPDRTSQSKAVRGFNGSTIALGAPKELEPNPLFHLRQYSNYLSPRLSFFSADSWSLVAIYLRNLCANQLILLPLVFAVVLLARFVVLGFASPQGLLRESGAAQIGGLAKTLGSFCGMLLPLVAFVGVTAALSAAKKRSAVEEKDDESPPPFFATRTCLALLLALLTFSSIGLSWLLVPASGSFPFNLIPQLANNDRTFRWDVLGGFVAVFGFLHVASAMFDERHKWWSSLIAGATFGALLYAIRLKFLVVYQAAPYLTATLGPPFVLLSFVLAAYAQLALLGRGADERQREWSARLCAWLLLIATCWSVVFGLALFGELWLWQLGEWWQVALTAGWLGSAIAGVMAARSAKTNGSPGGGALDVVGIAAPFVFLVGLACALSSLTSFVFDDFQIPDNLAEVSAPDLQRIIDDTRPLKVPQKAQPTEKIHVSSTVEGDVPAKTIETTMAVVRAIETPDRTKIAGLYYWWCVENTEVSKLFGWLVGALGVSAFAAWRVDVNAFSLNAMYANRLTRCYLGASRRKSQEDLSGTRGHSHGHKRTPNEVTGFDLYDDLPLFKLRIGTSEKDDRDHDQSKIKPDADRLPYWGPFPLINTALNLVAGDELAWQERMADSFTLSPLYCGSASLGYRNTEKYAAGRGWQDPLSLGHAVAISGAAANPNMGHHSSPAATALMTIFNVRLGWWLPNPNHQKSWTKSGPTFGITWLLSELFGLTNSRSEFLNISDGGHFENLGVYELIRRRCRCIIVSDAGADPKFEFEDLAGLIRKCRTDLGVEIEIDVSQVRPKSGSRHSSWHCAIGKIRYDRVEATAPVGMLIYLKPTLTGDEPTDIQHYAEKHAEFPHQPTLDQFFSESQFECHRELGYHCASDVFREVVEGFRDRVDASVSPSVNKNLQQARRAVEDQHRDITENLVYHIHRKWLVPPDLDEELIDSTAGFVELHRELRDSRLLDQMTQQMYFHPPSEARSSGSSIQPQSAKPDGATAQSQPAGDVTARAQARVIARLGLPADEAHRLRQTAEIHAACELLQVLENAWVAMKLEKYHAHPINAGWMNLFGRWSKMDALRRYWPLLRGEFSREFVAFCERESSLKVNLEDDFTKLEFFDEKELTLLEQMDQEYWREWPEETVELEEQSKSNKVIDPEPPRGLVSLFKNAWKLPKNVNAEKPPAFWYLRVKLKVPIQDDPLSDGFVAGLIGLRDLKPDEVPTEAESRIVDKTTQHLESCDKLTSQEKQDRLKSAKQEEISPKAGAAYELVLWVRPGFRQQRIGKTLIQSFFKMLWKDNGDPLALGKAIGKSSKLVVYYPKKGGWGSQDKLAKAQWMSYFAFYGFRRPGSEWPYSKTHEVLVRDMADLADYNDLC